MNVNRSISPVKKPGLWTACFRATGGSQGQERSDGQFSDVIEFAAFRRSDGRSLSNENHNVHISVLHNGDFCLLVIGHELSHGESIAEIVDVVIFHSFYKVPQVQDNGNSSKILFPKDAMKAMAKYCSQLLKTVVHSHIVLSVLQLGPWCRNFLREIGVVQESENPGFGSEYSWSKKNMGVTVLELN